MIEQFHFLRPGWLLLLTPLLGVCWLLLRRRQDSGNWRSVIDERLLPFVLSGGAVNRRDGLRWIPGLVALFAIVVLHNTDHGG